MRQILRFILKILAKAVIFRYRPKIIGITGSVGKTSTKEAVFTVLKEKFKARASNKNFNNEIGTPLTILGQSKSPGKNLLAWFWIFISAIKLLIIKDKNYPEILILEMGADRPGDIGYLTSIALPNISVITAIGFSHLESFHSLKNIIKEKTSILSGLAKDDWAILNNDDPNLEKAISHCQSLLYTFGKKNNSHIRISDVNIIQKNEVYGTNFKLSYSGSEVPMFLPYVLGSQHAQAAAAAAAVALALGMNLVEIGERLLDYQPARGRTNLIKGLKDTWIIDDTYNASPQSAKVALDILLTFPSAGRKIAVMGDMLELGALSEEGHQEVGRELVRLGIDYLYVIGERSRDIARGAREAGMSDDYIYYFAFTREAGIFLQEKLQPHDVILVKGSRGAKMEQIVYEIMAKPWLAKDLLVGPIIK